MERDQAIKLIQQLLTVMKQKGGSDLFITAGFPPAMKLDGQVTPVMDKPLTGENSALLVRALMSDRQIKEFEATNECNFAIAPPGIGRFRVSVFVQMGQVGAVLRTITTEIPTFEQLQLPEQLKQIVMSKRGLVLLVGATGSGKSTSLAAMQWSEVETAEIVGVRPAPAATGAEKILRARTAYVIPATVGNAKNASGPRWARMSSSAQER